jgi:hypothetical protein
MRDRSHYNRPRTDNDSNFNGQDLTNYTPELYRAMVISYRKGHKAGTINLTQQHAAVRNQLQKKKPYIDHVERELVAREQKQGLGSDIDNHGHLLASFRKIDAVAEELVSRFSLNDDDSKIAAFRQEAKTLILVGSIMESAGEVTAFHVRKEGREETYDIARIDNCIELAVNNTIYLSFD